MSEQVEATTASSENSTDEATQEGPLKHLYKLVELSIKYPEIGPPLAELASQVGHSDITRRLVRMGLESDSHGVEYYYIGAQTARREGRFDETLTHVLDAVRKFQAQPVEERQKQEGQRLLHLIRLGFSTLMFEIRDLSSDNQFIADLTPELVELESSWFSKDPFFRTLLAQTLWFQDRERSEEEWTKAETMGNPEFTWNARGTWYREAEKDFDKAEEAYRNGLEASPHSSLINHNIAQILLERIEGESDEDKKRKLVNKADTLIRAALKSFSAKGLRRHIYATRDRLQEIRAGLPRKRRSEGGEASEGGGGRGARKPLHDPPKPGENLTGKVRSLTTYGAFIQLPSGHVGLLHKSHIAHEHVNEPADVLSVGEDVNVRVMELSQDEHKDRLRISLSRKLLLDPPANADKAGDGNADGGTADGGAKKRPGRGKSGPKRPPRDGARKPRGDKRDGHGSRDHESRPSRDGGGGRRDRESDAKRQEKQEKLASLGEMLLAKISSSDDSNKG